jgi:hypothetical protein
MTFCERKNIPHCVCNCIQLPEQYHFDSKTLKLPKLYKKMRKLVNCVEYKNFFDIFDNKITKVKNYNNMCSCDSNNLAFLYYASMNLHNKKCVKSLIDGFPIHQGIGFTTFVQDICLEKLNKKTVYDIFLFFHTILTKIYTNIDENNHTQLVYVIMLLDITHHFLRTIAAMPNIIANCPKKALFRIIHNIIHWISLFTLIFYEYLNTQDIWLFEMLVQNPFLLSQWFCLNGM